jgi:hypothetical protein
MSPHVISVNVGTPVDAPWVGSPFRTSISKHRVEPDAVERGRVLGRWQRWASALGALTSSLALSASHALR